MTNFAFTLDEIKDQIVKHEGYRNKPYRDTEGILTIGIGHNLEEHGLPDEVIEYIFFKKLRTCIEECRKMFPSFDELSPNRQKALIDMMFNLGYTRLGKFIKMRKAIANGDYAEAASQMLDSKWAKQVKGRATTLAEMMHDG